MRSRSTATLPAGGLLRCLLLATLAGPLGGCLVAGSGTRSGEGLEEDASPDGEAPPDADVGPDATPSSCSDGAQGGSETDVDCGGPDCEPCRDGAGCVEGRDCASLVCEDGLCAAPACDDGERNAEETDVDCGGPDCDPCPASGSCARARDCQTSFCAEGSCREPRSCFDLLSHVPSLGDGVYEVVPEPTGERRRVLCDMTTDGGGWTLVASSRSEPPDDARIDWHEELLTVYPGAEHPGVWDGLRAVLSGDSDVRYTCRADPDGADLDVDLSFYRTEHYRAMTSGTDADSCFSPRYGEAFPDPAPARRDNLGGVVLRAGERYSHWLPIGEDSCDDLSDFTVDLDDAWMDSDQGDGTDWGEDDDVHKCGEDDVGDGTWMVWVREADPRCGDGERTGDESDLDCGGPCAPCPSGRGCFVDGECESGRCTGNRCAWPSCSDGVENGGETDVDCGGSCPECGLGMTCALSSDCAAPLVCVEESCRPPGGGPCAGAGSCPRGLLCEDGRCRFPRSCAELHAADPSVGSGLALLSPDGSALTPRVRCDMETDGGGWTLVSATGGIPPADVAGGWSESLLAASAPGRYVAVWDGLRDAVGATHDVRFTCSIDAARTTLEVDLSFYGVPWYLEMTTGTDADCCFEERDGRGDTSPPPARRNNLTGEALPVGDPWNAGYLEGEDDCNDWDDFAVDFDDRGCDGEALDGTDWGASDWSPKCGYESPAAGAWYVWVR